MTVVDGGASGAGLISRVKNILIKPRPEWEAIEGEPTTIRDIYLRYACILAAIPSVCQLIASQVFGRGLPGIITYKPSLVASLGSAILTYILALVGVFIVALIIDALAPSFGAVKNRTQAFKVAAYSSTAAWVGGIFLLLPPLSILAVLAALYGVYLLYLGLPKLMKAPDDKAIAYTGVSILAAIVVYWIAAVIVGSIVAATIGFGGLGAADRIAAGSGGVVSIGGRQVDVGKLQDTAREMERTARQMQSGETSSIPVDRLQGMLPAALGAMTRTSMSTDTAGALGSGAHARYENGESSIELTIADSAMGGALANLGGAFGVSHTETTVSGYEKVGVVNGRMTQEKYDKSNRSGQYSIVVGKRFMVQATGSQVEMSDLKGAVNALNVGRLEALAKG